MSTGSQRQIRLRAGTTAISAAVDRALTETPEITLTTTSVAEVAKVLTVAGHLGLEVEDQGGITLHVERLLSQTHGRVPHRTSAVGILKLRRPSFELPPGIGQAIQEAEDLGPNARILIYAAGAPADPNWLFGGYLVTPSPTAAT